MLGASSLDPSSSASSWHSASASVGHPSSNSRPAKAPHSPKTEPTNLPNTFAHAGVKEEYSRELALATFVDFVSFFQFPVFNTCGLMWTQIRIICLNWVILSFRASLIAWIAIYFVAMYTPLSYEGLPDLIWGSYKEGVDVLTKKTNMWPIIACVKIGHILGFFALLNLSENPTRASCTSLSLPS